MDPPPGLASRAAPLLSPALCGDEARRVRDATTVTSPLRPALAFRTGRCGRLRTKATQTASHQRVFFESSHLHEHRCIRLLIRLYPIRFRHRQVFWSFHSPHLFRIIHAENDDLGYPLIQSSIFGRCCTTELQRCGYSLLFSIVFPFMCRFSRSLLLSFSG